VRGGCGLGSRGVPGAEHFVLSMAHFQEQVQLGRGYAVGLSACNTACSRVGSEEGMQGIARVFLCVPVCSCVFRCAGAQALVVSLWSVGDEKTANSCTILTRNWRACRLRTPQVSNRKGQRACTMIHFAD
jgi:hypothetical protein